jgi:hypothetical protein
MSEELSQMQTKIDNINSSLQMLINFYSKNSEVLQRVLENQNNNKSPKILRDKSYNTSISRYETLKDFSNELLTNIGEIKNNLDILEMKVNDVKEVGMNVMKNINNTKISNLQTLSEDALVNNVDTSQLNTDQLEYVDDLLTLQEFSKRKGGNKLSRKRYYTKHNLTKISKRKIQNKRK